MKKFATWVGKAITGFKNFLIDARVWRVITVFLLGVYLLCWSEHLEKRPFWHTLTHEIGFALLVSSIVWSLFELHMAQDADREWSKRIEKISQNVFLAVLRKDLPKALIDEARTSALDTDLIRYDFTVSYTLRDHKIDLGGGNSLDCVLMIASVSFSMHNISSKTVRWGVRLGLPNPIHLDMKALTKVSEVKARRHGTLLPLKDPKVSEAEFREAIKSDENATVTYDAGTADIAPGETLDFNATYTMAKESEDSELLQTRYPTDRLSVTIFDQTGDGDRVVFAKAVHRTTIENEASPDNSSTKIFKIPGYLLPHQGVLIWWKRTPKGAQPQLPGLT